jgi:hypothetical protein
MFSVFTDVRGVTADYAPAPPEAGTLPVYPRGAGRDWTACGYISFTTEGTETTESEHRLSGIITESADYTETKKILQ